MPLRDLLVFLAVVLLLPLSFRRPFIGLLLFSWLAYMRPQDLCWGFARGMRFSFYVATTMIVGWWVNESHRRKFIRPEVRSYLLIALAVLISISLLFAEAYSALTFRYYFEFLKIIVIALFTLSQVDSKAKIRMLLWVICASLAFYAVKNGLLGFVRGGAVILRGPGGMLEDNNDFALALVMNIPLLWYLRTQENNKWLDRACLAAIFLTMVTVMLTHSRGGFLAMSLTILWILYRSGRILQAGMSGLAMVGMFFAFAPAHVIERVLSIGAGRTDSSVASRLDSWALAVRMFADNPMWGVGLRNFVDNADRYGKVEAGATFVHVAHNSFLQIAAEGLRKNTSGYRITAPPLMCGACMHPILNMHACTWHFPTSGAKACHALWSLLVCVCHKSWGIILHPEHVQAMQAVGADMLPHALHPALFGH